MFNYFSRNIKGFITYFRNVIELCLRFVDIKGGFFCGSLRITQNWG